MTCDTSEAEEGKIAGKDWTSVRGSELSNEEKV